MKDTEEFQIAENQEFSEFQITNNEYFLPQEVGIKVDDVFITPETQTQENENINHKTVKTRSRRLKENSNIKRVVNKVTTSISTIVVTGVAAATLVTNIIYAPPEVEIDVFEYGSDYVSFAGDFQDFDSDLDYEITLSDGQNIVYEKEAKEGENKDWIVELTPDNEYTFALTGTSKEKATSVYYEKKFTTLNSSISGALVDYNIVFDNYIFIINYNIYTSNPNNDKIYKVLLSSVDYDTEGSPEKKGNFLQGEFICEVIGDYYLDVYEVNENDDYVDKVKSVLINIRYPVGYYEYHEYDYQELDEQISISAKITGSLNADECYKMLITETSEDDLIYDSVIVLDIYDNYTDVLYQKHDNFSSISYKVCIAKKDSSEFEYEKEIYHSEIIGKTMISEVNYLEVIQSISEENSLLCDLNLQFTINLPYDSYYIVTDGINESEPIYTNSYLIPNQSYGNYTYYYQVYDSNGESLSEPVEINIIISMPENLNVYQEYEFTEYLDNIIVKGNISDKLLDKYKININYIETLDDGLNRYAKQEIIPDVNGDFEISYLKDSKYNGLSYYIELQVVDNELIYNLYNSNQLGRTLITKVDFEKQVISENRSDNSLYDVVLSFDAFLPYNSYYIINDGSVDSDKIYENEYGIKGLNIGTYTFSYQVFDASDNPITSSIDIICVIEKIDSNTYYFTTPNPSDVLMTFNDDNTMNLYFKTLFEDTDNSGLYYRIYLISGLNDEPAYTYEGTSKVGCILNVAKDSYILNYGVYQVNGKTHQEIEFVYPSGSVSCNNLYVSSSCNENILDISTYHETSGDLKVTVTYDDLSVEIFNVATEDKVNDVFSIQLTHNNISTVKMKGLIRISMNDYSDIVSLLEEAGEVVKGSIYCDMEIDCRF